MTETLVVFGHHDACFGIAAASVREIAWLPELSPIDEMPAHVAGVFNLRGRVVPVIDLARRFGRPGRPYRASDQVIVIEDDRSLAGIVVNELFDVVDATPEDLDDAAAYREGLGAVALFVRGVAPIGERLAMLLDVDALLRSTPDAQTLAALAGAEDSPAAAFVPTIEGTRGPVFHERAIELAREPAPTLREVTSAFAVVAIGGERFALPATLVREFCHRRGVTPVPCCPPHIEGDMNLRGNILTIVDLRPALGLAGGSAPAEVVVVRIGDLRLGIAAERIIDVTHLAPSDIAPVPAGGERAGPAPCKGVAHVDGHAVGILDLEGIVASGILHVTGTGP